MATLPLSEYIDRINNLLENNQFSEAISHCDNILQKYPLHMNTNRLLAKAYFETQQFDNALKAYEYILSVNPHDFITHVGLSRIYQKNNLANKEIKHLQIAFEIQPFNKIIRKELKDLYESKPEYVRDDLTIAQSILARMYIEQNEFEKARIILQKLCLKQPNRFDWQVLLAETCWRLNEFGRASEICQTILSDFPDCYMANAILGDILLGNQRSNEAQKHFSVVQDILCFDKNQLDISTTIGTIMSKKGAIPLPDVIEVEILITPPTIFGIGKPTDLKETDLDNNPDEPDEAMAWLESLKDDGGKFKIDTELESSSESFDKVPTLEETDDKPLSLRLDTAVPNKVIIGHPFDLAVAVRHLSSPILNEPDLKKIKSGNIQIEWPTEQAYIRLRVEVKASTCEIHGSNKETFKLFQDQDSPVFYFELTPQRIGNITIIVTIYQELDWLGSARIKTNALTQIAGEVVTNVISQSLSPDHISRFHSNMTTYFNLSELQEICLSLGISHEEFRPTLSPFVLDLIEYCGRRNKLDLLFEAVETARPNVYWRIEPLET